MSVPDAIDRAKPDGDRPGERWYDIHGLVYVHVDDTTPGSTVIDENLAYFRNGAPQVSGPSSAAVLQIVGSVERARRALGIEARDGCRGPGFLYGAGWFTTDNGKLFVAKDAERVVIGAENNVDRVLLPLLDWVMAPQRTCMVHGAAVAFGGDAVVISGWGGVGKTATLASLCREPDARFLADDMVFVSADGTALSLPKPMYIYPYHRSVFPELFSAAHKPLVPVRLTRMTERLRTAVRPLFTKAPRLENLARRLTPEHMKTPPEVAMPGVRFADSATVRLIIRLERSASHDSPSIDLIESNEATDGLVHEFVHEVMDATGMRLPIAASSSGVYPMQRWLGERQTIIEELVASSVAVRIVLPENTDSTTTSRLVTSVVRERLA